MKRILFFILLCLCLTLLACTIQEEATTEVSVEEDLTAEAEGVMSYEDFKEKEAGAPVVIEARVKEKSGWKDQKAELVVEDADGIYYLEKVICSQEEYETLTIGTKISVTGYKAEADGRKITEVSFEKTTQ